MEYVAVADWRDPAAYAALLDCGRAGLAWEVLRRDAGYQAAAKSVRAARSQAQVGNILILPVADAAFTERWGLHFR